MKEITYSNKPVTLGEYMLMSKVVKGDILALCMLIEARTNLSGSEVLQLDIDETVVVLDNVAKGLDMARTLADLGKQFADE